MFPEKRLLAGVPVDPMGNGETIEKIVELIERYRKKHPTENFHSPAAFPPSYVCTLNVDFLANVHGWACNTIRFPELYRIILRSAIVTPDGMPVVWLSRMLSSPLKERVSGADLVPLLAERMAEEGFTIYLLGGEKSVAVEAKEYLENINPGLRVVGVSSPMISINGKEIIDAEERDALVLEEIHEASPDLLLVCLGHPKQEIWFDRVRDKLRVPVAIGVGGTLNFLTGQVRRAPAWMQSLGLEWMHRLFQEPSRLFKRYSYDAFHFLNLSVPLVLGYRLNQIAARLACPQDGGPVRAPLLFLSPDRSIAVVRLPAVLGSANVKEMSRYFREAFAQDALLIDFHNTWHIDPAGLGLLQSVWQSSEQKRKTLYGFGMRWNVRLLLRLQRAWSLFSASLCSSAGEAAGCLADKKGGCPLYESFHQSHNTLTIHYFGCLDHRHDFELALQRLIPMLQEKNCVVDLSYCTLIDNTGFTFLLKLKKHVEQRGCRLSVRGCSRSLARQFRVSGLSELV